MEFKQSTLGELVESERIMVLTAAERYPAHYPHALEAVLFPSNSLKSIDGDRWVFAMFLSQVKKHLMLALLSTMRLHRVQAKMDLRQVLEAGAAAAFAIANPEHKHFVDTDEDGILDPSQELARKRHKWLEEHYPDGSTAIKGIKDIINSISAHANLVVADHNFRINREGSSFDNTYFDDEDEYHVKADLWLIGNIVINLMGTFSRVNQDRNVMTFVDDFERRLSKLANDSIILRDQMTGSERYKQTEELMRRRSS